MAGAAGGELFCGCRSSGNLGVALQSTGGGRCGRLRVHVIVLSTMVHSGGSSSGSGHDGGELRPWWKKELGDEIRGGEWGKEKRSSRGVGRDAKWAQ